MNTMRAHLGNHPPTREDGGLFRWLRNAAFSGVLVALLPRLAHACPACFAASNERVLPSYYLTGVFMTLVPLVIVGLFARWLRQRFKDEPN